MMREQQRLQNKIKRQREVNRQIRILVLTACLIIVFAIVFGSFFSKANSPSEQGNTKFKYFKSTMIEYGDTLSDLALAYHTAGFSSSEVYLNEIIKINNITSDDIHTGEYLILPYYSEEFK